MNMDFCWEDFGGRIFIIFYDREDILIYWGKRQQGRKAPGGLGLK